MAGKSQRLEKVAQQMGLIHCLVKLGFPVDDFTTDPSSGSRKDLERVLARPEAQTALRVARAGFMAWVTAEMGRRGGAGTSDAPVGSYESYGTYFATLLAAVPGEPTAEQEAEAIDLTRDGYHNQARGAPLAILGRRAHRAPPRTCGRCGWRAASSST